MGLTGKITPDQVAKKWDNLKTKFKDLKFPPRGMEGQTNPASWPWFQLMNEALEGRLAGKAPRVAPVWSSEEDGVFVASPPHPPDRDCLLVERSSVSELESLGGGEGNVTYIDASGEECSTPSDLSYKMTDQDTRRMIQLRSANEGLFTGRRNAAKAAWKAILKELGLGGKVSTYQMAKKWDNLKRRYKDLKFPPVGMEIVADSTSSWPWFHLMNEAMEGRLTNSAPLLTPVTQGDEQQPSPRHKSRHAPTPPTTTTSSLDYGQQAFGDAGEQNKCGPEEESDGPLGGLERERMEREREAVEREWEAVEREREAVQSERLWLERERAAVERDRAAVERDRAMLEQERASLGRDREVLDQRTLMLNSVGHSGHLNALM
uniref:Myb/SANT-like DNA-binding domain-containing protein n=2 Tax=Gasterosteus aculeatus aculeatus TaxID=481459 RepID=A0AAQ4QT56_GASAC